MYKFSACDSHILSCYHEMESFSPDLITLTENLSHMVVVGKEFLSSEKLFITRAIIDK